MQWPEKRTDAPIQPYKQDRCKLTNGNCAIDPEKQARLYMKWALDKGLKQIHVFRENSRSRPSSLSHYGLRTALRDHPAGGKWMKFPVVNREDWT